MKNKKVHSFDVFDTSIVRIWAKPTDLFWEVGYQLQKENLIQISPESWSQIRMETERTAREIGLHYEVTLEEIYTQLARSLNWSTDETQRAKNQEIETELSSLRPIPATQKRIQSLARENQRIIYISDMYLPKEVIRNFLKSNKVWTSGSNLYVSSEVRVNKGSGKLFQHCLAQEAIQKSQLYHIGDNLRSDIKAAKKLGIPCEAFTQAHLNRYESKIADTTTLPLKFRSLLAGASRLTRLQSQETSSDKQVIWDTTASAIAPMLFGFVYWCLVEAQKRGIQRLYFVARDGQILHKIARVICQNWGFTIECRYLYGSRQAWHMPAIQEIGDVELGWLIGSAKFLSIRSICNRVNISPEQIEDVLSRNGFPSAKWDLNLQPHERDFLKQLFKQKEVAELIISTAITYREKVIGYFRQEGLGDGVPFGFVDIGWSGRTQHSLSKLLDIAGFYPESGVYSYFFGLEQEIKPFHKDCLQAYFYDAEKPSDRFQICKYRCLFELFVAADHGSTVSYDRSGECYIPILRSSKNEQAIQWGLYILQDAAVEFAKQITTNLNKQECTTDLFSQIAGMVAKELVLNPSSSEAEVFGSFVLSGDQTENILYELAPVYTLTDWSRRLFYGKHPHEDVWHPASIARGNTIIRALLRPEKISIIRKIRNIPNKIKRVFILKPFQAT